MIANIPYPNGTVALCSSWENGFEFPQAFVEELIQKFPGWDLLHQRLRENDEAMVWALLWEYHDRIGGIRLEEIVNSETDDTFSHLVERAKGAIAFNEYLVDLEQRHFPAKVLEREKQNRLAAMSYE